MRVVLQGSLQHFAARELLAFLAANHSGTFDAESGGERIRLALRDGKIVGAEGDSDAIGVMAKLLGWSDGAFSFLDDVVLPDIEAQELATLSADDGTMHPLLDDEATIGRTPANSIALRDGSVSAHHARVVRTSEGFLIEDVGSRNGTYINSEKVAEKRLLVDGDLIRLGKIIMTFNIAAEAKRQQSTERDLIA